MSALGPEADDPRDASLTRIDLTKRRAIVAWRAYPPGMPAQGGAMKQFVLALLASLALASPLHAEGDSEGLADRGLERRAVEAVIWGMPAVNYDLMRQEMLDTTDAEPNQVLYWGRPLDWMNQTLTPNPDTLYFMVFYDTHGGPVAIEVPAANGGSFNGNIVTAWQMPVEDLGLLGIDKGAGGKFVLLPPGYAEDIPEGFTPLRPDTFGGFALIRANLESHAPEHVANSVAYGKQVKVYPLSEAGSPPETVFVDAQDVLFDSTIRYDASFFEHLDRVVQEEPWLDRDRAMIDPLKTLGIEKGKPFKPDADTRAALDAAAVEGKNFLYDMYDRGWGAFYEGTQWCAAAPPALAKAAGDSYTTPDAYPTDLRGMVYTLAFVGIKRLGAGQFYLLTIADKDGAPLDGAASYRLTVPPDVPVEQYWSATVYDRQSHALVRHMDRASRSSQLPELAKNPDGSVDIFFGPEPPQGKEANWVPTDPARDFEVMFRLYAPTQALFNKSWTLADIERVD